MKEQERLLDSRVELTAGGNGNEYYLEQVIMYNDNKSIALRRNYSTLIDLTGDIYSLSGRGLGEPFGYALLGIDADDMDVKKINSLMNYMVLEEGSLMKKYGKRVRETSPGPNNETNH